VRTRSRFTFRARAVNTRSPKRWWIESRKGIRPTRPPDGPGDDVNDRARDLPLPPPPAEDPATETEAVKNDSIDRVYLAELDDRAGRSPTPQNLHRLAQGYQQAAIFLTRQGNPEGALDLYRHALKIAPNDLALTLAMAYLLVKQTYYNEAVSLPAAVKDQHAKVAAIPCCWVRPITPRTI